MPKVIVKVPRQYGGARLLESKPDASITLATKT
jgi:hypothetical protein